MNEQTTSVYRKAFDTYVGLVRLSAYYTAATGKVVLRSVAAGLDYPASLQPHIVDKLKAELPRREARIALDAILRGKAHKDPELTMAGEAMLTKAVSNATTSRRVPPDVTQEVLQIAHDVQLDPGATPVDQFTINQAQHALQKYDETRS